MTHQQEHEHSGPLFALWRETVSRAEDAGGDLNDFGVALKQFYAVGLMDDEVRNSGFDQYFFNGSGGYYRHVLAGLEAMGAAQSLQLLQRAKQVLFDFADVPEKQEARRALMIRRASDSRFRRLDALDAQYCKDPDALSARMEQFALRNGLIPRQ